MPSPYRTLSLALHAISFLAFSELSNQMRTLASPLPTPLPLVAPGYALRPVSIYPPFSDRHNDNSSTSPLAARYVVAERQNTNYEISDVDNRDNYRNTKFYVDNLKTYADRSSSIGSSDVDFQQDSVTALRGVIHSLDAVRLFLAQGAEDKGLANYDPDNSAETSLKVVINWTKDALRYSSVLVDNVPVLGPILGPIVYELKCITEEILDLIENITDGTINDLGLKPILQGIATQAGVVVHGIL